MSHNMILPLHKGASPLVAPEAQSSLILDGTNALIAQMYMVAADWPQRRDFIVRAVNCHDELLEACQFTRDFIERIKSGKIGPSEISEQDIRLILGVVNKAIRKATHE